MAFSISKAFVSVNEGRARGWTDLHFAIYEKNLVEVDNQIAIGADIDARTNDGETALHIAINGNKHCIKGILKHNPSMNVADKKTHFTPLIILVMYMDHKPKTLRLMLEMGADPNLPQIDGDTPLHIVAKVKNDDERAKAVKYAVELIKYGANVNARNKRGDTPILVATRTNFFELIPILLRNGCHKRSRNLARKEPIRVIIHNHYDYIINYYDYFMNYCDYIDNYYNFDSSDKLLDSKKSIVIGTYAVLQDSIKQPVLKKQDLKEYYRFSTVEGFKQRCDRELSKLKRSVTDETIFTYYDLLVSPINVVSKYLRNEDTLYRVREFNYRKYEIYGYRLFRIYREAYSRNKAIDIGYQFFEKFSPVLPNLCLDKIFDYLSTEDFLKLKHVTEFNLVKELNSNSKKLYRF